MVFSNVMLLRLLSFVVFVSSVMGLEPTAQDVSALINLAVKPDIQISDSIKAVATMMQSIDKLPSCTYLASRTLANSCSQLDQSSTNGLHEGLDTVLDKAKSIYGARLAVCELLDANVPVPSVCSAFKPNSRNTRKQGFRGFFSAKGPSPPVALYEVYDEETVKHHDACVLSLNSKPQWWTSYSNARQNAVALCHSMRAEVEKDDIIEFSKMMMDVASQSTADMANISKQSVFVLRDFQALRNGMEHFQTALNEDLEDVQQAIAEHWAHLKNEVLSVAKDVSEVGVNLNSVLQDSQRAADNLDLHNTLSENSVEAVRQLNDMIVSVKESAIDSLGLQTEVHDNNAAVLAFLNNMVTVVQTLGQDMSNVHTTLAEFDHSLSNTREVVETISRDAALIPTITGVFHCLGTSIWEFLGWFSGYFAIWILVSALVFVSLEKSRFFDRLNSGILGCAVGFATAVFSSTIDWSPVVSSFRSDVVSHLMVCSIAVVLTIAACACYFEYKDSSQIRAMQTAALNHDVEAQILRESVAAYSTVRTPEPEKESIEVVETVETIEQFPVETYRETIHLSQRV